MATYKIAMQLSKQVTIPERTIEASSEKHAITQALHAYFKSLGLIDSAATRKAKVYSTEALKDFELGKPNVSVTLVPSSKTKPVKKARQKQYQTLLPGVLDLTDEDIKSSVRYVKIKATYTIETKESLLEREKWLVGRIKDAARQSDRETVLDLEDDLEKVQEKLKSETLPTQAMVDHFEKRTKEHIARVQKNCKVLAEEFPGHGPKLLAQGEKHDASKFSKEEYLPYVWITHYYAMKNSDQKWEYPEAVKAIVGKAWEVHSKNNSHHPHHHANVKNMTDVDLLEMVADWAAMSQELCDSLKEFAESQIKKVPWSKEQVGFIRDAYSTFM